MKEATKDRIQRLQIKKGELRGQIKKLRDNPNTRNLVFKVSRLEAQVSAVNTGIKKLQSKNNVKGGS